jgi:hypothetical protein
MCTTAVSSLSLQAYETAQNVGALSNQKKVQPKGKALFRDWPVASLEDESQRRRF